MKVGPSEMKKYDQLKRKIYLIILPIFFVTCLFYAIVSPNATELIRMMLIPTSLFILICWFLIYRYIGIRYFEFFSILIASIFHLLRIHAMAHELAIGDVNVYMFWAPIFYILVFIMIDRKYALLIATTIFTLSIFLTAPIGSSIRAYDIMIQLYLSTAIYVIVLFYFSKIVSAYMESDIHIRQAYHDYLTGIGNRRSIDLWFDQAIERAATKYEPFSIIYFDIDHFKAINDQYGHDVGDQILQQFVKTVSTNATPSDLFGRWGGEEFILICTDRDLVSTQNLAERIRANLEGTQFPPLQQLTASFGVTLYQCGDTKKSMMKRSDNALYCAKERGRNCVVTEIDHYSPK